MARSALAAAVPLLILGACSSDKNVATSASSTIVVPTTFGLPTSTIAATSTSGAPTATTAAPTTIAPPTTLAATTTSVTETTVPDAVETTVATQSTCPGPTALPADAVTGDQITGNVDGDGVDDVVTAYTGTDGAPHIFLQRGSGGGSDVTLPLGSSTTVKISFEDFDRSVGAVTPPPLVVMAIGAGQAGSAPVTFLSAVEGAGGAICLTQWLLDGQPFAFTIDQRGPFSGLLCDHAAGRTYYVLRTATPIDPATTTTVATTVPPTIPGSSTSSSSTLPPVTVAFTTTATQIDHEGATVTLTELGGGSIPDDPELPHKYGDILGCDHPPLFP